MHGNGLTHNDLHADNIATGYHNRSKIYLIGNLNFALKIGKMMFHEFFYLDFGHVDVNKSRETTDLERFSYGLYEILSNSYEEARSKLSNSYLIRYYVENFWLTLIGMSVQKLS